jgi:hypothetical protein
MTATLTAAILFTSLVAVFLIMELDRRWGGVIRISGEPMINALNHFTK